MLSAHLVKLLQVEREGERERDRDRDRKRERERRGERKRKGERERESLKQLTLKVDKEVYLGHRSTIIQYSQ